MVAQVTFRSDNIFSEKFGRELADGNADKSGIEMWDRFEVERYLDHHGDKLIRRFDANSYLIIGKAMDLHDVGRGRGGVEAAIARIQVPVVSVGIWSDILYPSYQQRSIRDIVESTGGTCDYIEIDSPHGHDAFLIEFDQMSAALHGLFSRLH